MSLLLKGEVRVANIKFLDHWPSDLIISLRENGEVRTPITGLIFIIPPVGLLINHGSFYTGPRFRIYELSRQPPPIS